MCPDNYGISNEPNGIYILPLSLDMFSSWMFYKLMKDNDTKDELFRWIDIISKINNNRYYNQIYNFSIRALETFSEVLEWFYNVEIPRYPILYNWLQDFKYDVSVMLDEHCNFDNSARFFERRYATFCNVRENPDDKRFVTKYICEYISDVLNTHSHIIDTPGYDYLSRWLSEKQHEIEKVGLVLNDSK